MNTLESLIKYFEDFPGVGARQARRFAFHLLTLPETETKQLAELITALPNTVMECESCRRFFTPNGNGNLCSICADQNRDRTRLLVVERDADIQPIERAGVYDGLYFVLGGTVPLLKNKEAAPLRANGLKKIVGERLSAGLAEIILAFAVNPDGENTTRFVRSQLAEVLGENATVTISELGRGLSTGSELEYADPDTLKNALQNRH
jgi:recombination protein RecR